MSGENQFFFKRNHKKESFLNHRISHFAVVAEFGPGRLLLSTICGKRRPSHLSNRSTIVRPKFLIVEN